MEEKRVTQRREGTPTPSFPLHTGEGDVIASDRRFLPTRRVNDIQVEELSCLDFISRLQ